MSEFPAFDEEGFEGYGFSFTVAAAVSSSSGGRVDRLRIYRRTPFLDTILVTASIQKPFEEQLIIFAEPVHVFNEHIYFTATPVKPFNESLILVGAINVMEWLYLDMEKLESKEE